MLEQKGEVGKLNVWRKFLNYSDSIEKITKTEAVSKCQSLYDYTQREKDCKDKINKKFNILNADSSAGKKRKDSVQSVQSPSLFSAY